jgi:DNA repair photolyase
VLVAPIIPGLTDRTLPAVLTAVAEAGAIRAGYVLLRLPGAVRPVFLEWLHRTQPLAAGRVESHVRAAREGKMYDAEFGSRMRGTGIAADQIEQMFDVFAKRLKLDRPMPPLDCSQFRTPQPREGQMRLF